ncbi:MAG: cupredoxin family copper-binding protein [Candidatus Moranbacteria bacterium]|nr:cupredoxin family copper-binding protein [Candidatus Moranbacteria bacterium]
MEEKMEQNEAPKESSGNTNYWVIGIIALVVVVGIIWYASKGKKGGLYGTPAAAPSQSSQSATQPAPNGTQNQTGSAVTVKNFAFSPADLTVTKGTTVTWTNEDSVPHQIASDSGSAVSFTGTQMSQGQSFSFTFDTAGAFPYHCAIHPTMHGVITVK